MKVGSFRQTQEPNRNAIHRKGLETSRLLRPEWMATAMTGKSVPWQGRVLTEADAQQPVLRELEMESVEA